MSAIVHNRCGDRRGAAWLKWRHAVALAIVFAVSGGACFAQAPPGEIPAAPSTPADPLSLARKHVQEYFEKFSDLACKESVTQIVLNNSGHTIYRENSAYDYQFIATGASGNFKFSETRELVIPPTVIRPERCW